MTLTSLFVKLFELFLIKVQEHIDKPDRDIRVFVVGGQPIAAIMRSSAHWVTNTARGATAEGLELTDELRKIAVNAADATGADIVAVDLLECPKRGLLVNELNHSMEFRNSSSTTGVDIAEHVARHVVQIAEGEAVSNSMHLTEQAVVA